MVGVGLFVVSQNTALVSPTWWPVMERGGDGCSDWWPCQIVPGEAESVTVQ
ncbi:hypothetical protein Hanom_Chr00s000006g01613821 [Helianthus anomalus]